MKQLQKPAEMSGITSGPIRTAPTKNRMRTDGVSNPIRPPPNGEKRTQESEDHDGLEGDDAREGDVERDHDEQPRFF